MSTAQEYNAQKQRIENQASPHKYFSMMMHMCDDDLNPYEYRLYGHYLRAAGAKTSCWEGTRKTAKVCQMSVGKVVSTRNSLEAKGYITIVRPPADNKNNDTIIVTIVDRWAENMARYTEPVQDVNGEGVHVVNRGVHVVNERINNTEDDKRALTETTVNGTHEMTSQNIAQNDTSAKRKRDPQYDAIAEVFETSLSGKIVNLQGQLFHSKRVRGEWESMKIHPPMSIDELREWARWERKNMRRYADGQERMPATPEVIARHIEDWRKLRNPSPEPKYAFEPDWTKQRPETPEDPQPWNPMYDKNDPKTWVKKPDFWGQPYKYVLVEDDAPAPEPVDVSSIPF